MTGRYLAQDVRDFIVTRLKDGTYGFNKYISTINTERSHTTPDALDITYKWGQNQFPFLLVDLQGSEAIYDDPATPMTLNYTTLPEVFTVLVVGFIKAYTDDIYNYVEDWIEAIIRSLHNYNDTNISWIAYTKTERMDVNDQENQTMKIFSVEFEIRIN